MICKFSVEFVLIIYIIDIFHTPMDANPVTRRPYIPAPMVVPMMWNKLGITTKLPDPQAESAACNKLSPNFEAYFCDPNKKLESAYVAESLTTLTNVSATCVNATEGFSVGVIVVNEVESLRDKKENNFSDTEVRDDVKLFATLRLEEWNKAVKSKCDARILLFVSCNDLMWYEATGNNTLSGVDVHCRHLFNASETVRVDKKTDCYTDIIKPRLDVYSLIANGTHKCYGKNEHGGGPYENSLSKFVVIGIVLSVICIFIVLCVIVVYKLKKPKSNHGTVYDPVSTDCKTTAVPV
jgi:hypothetical protein